MSSDKTETDGIFPVRLFFITIRPGKRDILYRRKVLRSGHQEIHKRGKSGKDAKQSWNGVRNQSISFDLDKSGEYGI